MKPHRQEWVGEVSRFWFAELDQRDWFSGREEVDAMIRQRFWILHSELARNPPPMEMLDAQGHVSAVLVFDQFSRNLFRKSADAFALDPLARAIASHALHQGLEKELGLHPRQFLYMPYMHSEDREDQARSIELFASLGQPAVLRFAEQHKAIVDRFGRFPHRNEALGRDSTTEEIGFMRAWPGFA